MNRHKSKISEKISIYFNKIFSFHWYLHCLKSIAIRSKRKLKFSVNFILSRDLITEKYFDLTGLQKPRHGWYVSSSINVLRIEPYYLDVKGLQAGVLGVYITNPGRMGNFYLQVWNAINVANYLNVPNVFHCSNQVTDFELNGVKIIKAKKKNVPTPVLRGDFLFCEILPKQKYNIRFKEVVNASVENATYFNSGVRSLPNLKEEYCAIHIRGGDVYRDFFPNPDYSQPPLIFYSNSVRESLEKKFVIVSEDFESPLLVPLMRFLESENLIFSFSINSISEDVSILLNATTIIASNGTFLFPIIAASQRLKKLFHCGNTTSSPVDVSFLLEDWSDEIRKNSKRYKHIEINYWLNSSYQKRLMLRR